MCKKGMTIYDTQLKSWNNFCTKQLSLEMSFARQGITIQNQNNK